VHFGQGFGQRGDVVAVPVTVRDRGRVDHAEARALAEAACRERSYELEGHYYFEHYALSDNEPPKVDEAGRWWFWSVMHSYGQSLYGYVRSDDGVRLEGT
jgi:hypothetical protein